jgi:hypothetical protein
MKKLFILFTLVLFTGTLGLFATAQTEVQLEKVELTSSINDDNKLYGAMAVEKLDEFTLEEMLRYSLEDERLALAEYELIMSKFNIGRPFSNIIEAEKTHEGFLLELYGKYGFEVPIFDATEHLVIPETIKETFDVGVKAEIINIAMYEKFLKYDLNDDVKEVFIRLRDGSVSHLASFKKQAAKY